ncbi:MAG: class II aldolase/adducin family protein [Desulfobacteraceae bacterium]|jgi:L-fuculose-phosphate aldolase
MKNKIQWPDYWTINTFYKMGNIMITPQKQIVETIRRIYQLGMTTLSGGNISLIDDNRTIWITPSAIDKGSLEDEDIGCIKKDNSIKGKHEPSSEYPFHQAIYKARSDIKAIIHAHPPALVSYSITRKIPDTAVFPKAREICGEVGYAPYELPGSIELGNIIANAFTDNNKLCVIMENHGLVVVGTSMQDAFIRLEALEQVSNTIISANNIGVSESLTNEQFQLVQQYFDVTMPDSTCDVVQGSDEEVRNDICRIVQRACNLRILNSAFGAVSARTTANNFIITPDKCDRWKLQPEELVCIIDGKPEKGKTPDQFTALHEKIYRKYPEINAITITFPANLMAYAITNAGLEVRTIPESWILLQDIPKISFDAFLSDDSILINNLSKNTPAIIISNLAFVTTGKDLLQTLDFIEVAEYSAKSCIMTGSIGDIKPLNEEQIEALRKKFI